MSDLIEKVAEAYLAAAGIDISNVTEKQRYREKELMGAAVKTVLEEMLEYLGDQPQIGTFDNSKWINRRNMVQAFARINNIPIGGENE